MKKLDTVSIGNIDGDEEGKNLMKKLALDPMEFRDSAHLQERPKADVEFEQRIDARKKHARNKRIREWEDGVQNIPDAANWIKRQETG